MAGCVKLNIAKLLILTGIVLSVAGIPDDVQAEDKKEESEGPKAERPKAKLERFDIYIHKWLKMPDISGRTVSQLQNDFNFKPQYGRGTVVVFLASYCEPCQEQMDRIRRLEDKYNKLFTDFIYVFVNDSNQDAMDFAKEYKLTGSTLAHGSHDTLKVFKNPQLPTIYIGDRSGWIGNRYLAVSGSEMNEVEKYLKLMTAY